MSTTAPGDHTLLPLSAPRIAHNGANSSSTLDANQGAATWPPSAASSAVTMHADSSALVPTAPTTEINLVSSPPTSHATSPTRVRSSPLRPSSAANVVVEASSGGRGTGKSAIAAYSVDPVEAYVANSDPEDDDEQIGHSDSAQASQPLSLPSSPVRSGKRAFAANIDQESSSSVYVQIPAASPSSRPPRQTPGSTKKNKKKQQSDTSRSGGSDAFDSAEQDAPTAVEDDDAAYAAALAAQEATLARRRPTRNARKEVSYGPNCDLEGRPLSSKRQKESTTKSKVAAKDSLTAQNARDKRRSRDFSDDDEEAVEGAKPGPSSSSKSKRELGSKHATEDDEDLTDDDIGFAARDRKKAKTSKLITAISDSEEEAATSRTTRGKKTQPERSSRRDKIKDDARVSDEGESERDNDILTPPAPTSPRRSTRRSVPSPKKKQAKEAAEDKPQKSAGKGKKKQRKTFDLDRDGEEEEEAEEKKDEGETVEDVAAQADEASRSSGQKIAEADGEEAEEEAVNSAPPAKPSASPTISKASLSTSSPALTSTSTPRSAPTTVAIKRIATSGTSSPTLHASSPTTSASPRSFFGKPLTTLLSTGAARRPGLTRKHNIPSLLNHRGAPKAPVRGLVVSKRRMQDDDYEYDAEYEALIAKGKKGSDDEDASDAEVVEKEEEGDEGLEEYD